MTIVTHARHRCTWPARTFVAIILTCLYRALAICIFFKPPDHICARAAAAARARAEHARDLASARRLCAGPGVAVAGAVVVASFPLLPLWRLWRVLSLSSGVSFLLLVLLLECAALGRGKRPEVSTTSGESERDGGRRTCDATRPSSHEPPSPLRAGTAAWSSSSLSPSSARPSPARHVEISLRQCERAEKRPTANTAGSRQSDTRTHTGAGRNQLGQGSEGRRRACALVACLLSLAGGGGRAGWSFQPRAAEARDDA